MRVVICDDHRLFTDALASVLANRGWTIVDTSVDPAHAVAAVARSPVDLCLMDLTFSEGMTGIAGIGAVRSASPTTAVVVLTASSDPEVVMDAIASGPDAIVFKDDDVDEIVEICERAVEQRGSASGETIISRRPAVAREPPAPPRADALGRFLTDREREVLTHLVRGESNKALARSLGISYSTARTHIQNILAKLGVHSRLEAVAFAIENGLTDAP